MTNPYGQNPYGQPPASPPYGTPAPYGQPPASPPYGQPPVAQPYGQQPYGAGLQGGGDINSIPDYKGWAIGCIFLMWIIAIFAIMKSNETQAYKAQGNYAMAQQSSQSTKTMCLIATIIGALGWVGVIFWFIFGVIAVASVSTYPY